MDVDMGWGGSYTLEEMYMFPVSNEFWKAFAKKQEPTQHPGYIYMPDDERDERPLFSFLAYLQVCDESHCY